MPQFQFKARDAQGALVEGVVESPDRPSALRQIEQRRCVPFRVVPINEVAVAGAAAISAPSSSVTAGRWSDRQAQNPPQWIDFPTTSSSSSPNNWRYLLRRG